MDQIYDVVIIGGGPAGISAAVYCARKKLKTLLIAQSFGGQSIVSADIQNWIGEPHISGLDLAKKLEAHIRTYSEIVEIKSPEKVMSVSSIRCLAGENRICDFEINSDQGGIYQGKSVILASGASPRKLNILGEEQFSGKGVAFCSTCDAPIFINKKVAVVGGGNSGLEAVHDLFPYASEVYLLESTDSLKGDPLTVEEIKQNPKLKEIILNAQILEILGETLVTGLRYKDKVSGQEKTLEVEGVFVEIGMVPNSDMVKDLVQLDEHGQVIINFAHARTSHPGVFAAGDVTNDPYKQNNISVGDGVRAALACYAYLQGREKLSPAAER